MPTVACIRSALSSHWADRGLIVVFVLLVRLPGFSHSVVADWDESMFILMGRAILEGRLPYVDIMQEKPLGVPVIMAIALGLFSDAVQGARMLGLGCVAVSCLLLRGMLLRTGLSRFVGAAAALAYAVLTTKLGGLATNAELVFAPFTIGGVAAMLRFDTTVRGDTRWIVVAGLLFGIAIWCKYITAFPPIAVFACIFLPALSRLGLPRVLGLGLLFAVLCWLPTLAGAAFYAGIGQWQAFWYWNIGFMAGYTGLERDPQAMLQEVLRFLWIARPVLLLAAVAPFLWRDAPRLVGVSAAWLLAEVAALVAPWKFWDHYFLLLFPPLCALAAVGMDGIIRRCLAPRRLASLAALPMGAVLLVPVLVAGVLLGTGAARDDRPDPARAVAALLRADNAPGNSVWVVNSEPIIYVLADLPVPTRYGFPLHLVSLFNFLTRGEAGVEVDRILAAQPRYLVLDPASDFWFTPDMRERVRAAIAAQYDLHATVPASGREIEVYRIRAAGSTR